MDMLDVERLCLIFWHYDLTMLLSFVMTWLYDEMFIMLDGYF